MKKMALNGLKNGDCPCRECIERYVGCHGICLKYVDWKQRHDIELQHIQEQRDMKNLLFNNQTNRNKKLKQQGGIKYGRRGDDSR